MGQKSFSGKTVYITGAGSGIGFETAMAFAAEGARIIACDIDEAGLAKIGEALGEAGAHWRTERLDVSNSEATKDLADQLEAAGWLPDIVISNAGIGYIGPFLESTEDAWRRTLAVNVEGVANGCRTYARKWTKAGRSGHLVNVASMASVTPVPSLAAYTASKYAVEGLCEILALELGEHDIEVTCIHPGIINTPIVQNPAMVNLPEAQMRKLQAHYVDKGAHPRDVAAAILAGIKRGKSNIFVGPGTGPAVLAKRLLPRSWFRSIVRGTAKDIGYL
ncbi:MAG: SDR family NAD(P)-dependent oxidoreductase [Hyphomonadaceae bacterium]|nr:SDR family NAD(P)-dependent oxidoreductase [Hyphomonadaceae bacterium]